LRDFADENGPGRDIFRRNLQLIDLTTPDRPEPSAPKLHKGALDRDAFTDLCGEFGFRSILKDFDTWLAPFEERLAVKEMA
jgi:hypothetical protein